MLIVYRNKKSACKLILQVMSIMAEQISIILSWGMEKIDEILENVVFSFS